LAVGGTLRADSGFEAAAQRGYDALRNRHYDAAVAGFGEAIRIEPRHAAIRKDLAYTLLKIGENEAAREQFRQAMLLDPADHHVALEYAFLCYETKQRAEARRVFDRVRREGDAQTRATAETAFHNVDTPLAEGIIRWLDALKSGPDNFSAHEELARLAEERDQLPLAAEHYAAAYRLRPDLRELLLDLGRVWKAMGRIEESNAALLAAARGAQPRVAERAKALSPVRYPYVYEFRKALDLDPKNVELRRELAYLLLQMQQNGAAETEFRAVLDSTPDDLLSAAQLGFLMLARKDQGGDVLLRKVLEKAEGELADRIRAALKMPQNLRDHEETTRSQVLNEAKALADKSLKAGYMKDALKYLTTAHEADPVDFDVMLKLGWANNILKQDGDALKWFNLARKSPDPAIAAEANRAYKNLRPAYARFRTTAWVFPMYSSRWQDTFAYGQVKSEMRIGNLPFRPYASVRFIGDTRGTAESRSTGMPPQYLSESSFIVAGGVAMRTWRGITGWFEAGEAMRYMGSRKDAGAMIPDYRGGVSFARGFGHLMSPSSHGWFGETNDDGVFISRFGNDWLMYSQNRTGYTFAATESWGLQTQLFWNWNLTADAQGQRWARYVETGPGVKLRFRVMPPSMALTVNAVRGNYFSGGAFNDVRVGFWYAFTR
jgi:Tfp pilus assembly protein PilF